MTKQAANKSSMSNTRNWPKAIDWTYDAPGQRVPVYVCKLFIDAEKQMIKMFGLKNQSFLASTKNYVNARICMSPPEARIAVKEFIQQILRKGGVRNLVNKSEKKSFHRLKRIKELTEKPIFYQLKGLSDKSLSRLWQQLCLSFRDFFAPLVLCESINWYLEEFIWDGLDNLKDNRQKRKFFEILTTTTSRQYRVKAEEFLFKIAILIKKNKHLKSVFLTKNFDHILSFKKINQLLKRCSRQFYWINNNYVDTYYLDEKFFVNELLEIIQQEDILRRLKNIQQRSYLVKKQKEKILKQLKIKGKRDYRNIVFWLDHLIYWTDMRKQGVARLAYFFNLLLKEIAERNSLSINEIRCLTPEEIEKLIIAHKVDKKFLAQRKKACIFLYSNKVREKFFSLEGAAALAFEKQVASQPIKRGKNEYKGMPVSPGKVIGKVRLLKSVLEVATLKRGEILVTGNTTPDFLPAMEKASAILTEKGGSTCHAAIVAREIKKPCVVGIRNLISVFKTGDKIEVDANKGLVKIIK
ncbi:hypothetical protein KKG58_00740 [Patescibacteria group bacterium]|nr:hypothetical protein [Patescibacteria group bacterium]